MSTEPQEIALPSREPSLANLSQATAIEQARAVAEVAAAVRVAQDYQRDLGKAREQMKQACAAYPLAERAFYSVPNRGSGASVHLARELARCWGNIQHGIVELRRDDEGHMSEVQAFAWDVENNTRSVRSFMVPHARMAGGRRRPLVDLTDIVNNNNNAGARAVRETIFTVVPTWFRQEAEDLCRATLERGEGEPLADRIANMVNAYGRGGVNEKQLEARLGKPRAQWDAQDVAALAVVYSSLRAGETTRDEEFPSTDAPVTAGELTGDDDGQEHDPTAEPDWGQR